MIEFFKPLKNGEFMSQLSDRLHSTGKAKVLKDTRPKPEKKKEGYLDSPLHVKVKSSPRKSKETQTKRDKKPEQRSPGVKLLVKKENESLATHAGKKTNQLYREGKRKEINRAMDNLFMVHISANRQFVKTVAYPIVKEKVVTCPGIDEYLDKEADHLIKGTKRPDPPKETVTYELKKGRQYFSHFTMFAELFGKYFQIDWERENFYLQNPVTKEELSLVLEDINHFIKECQLQDYLKVFVSRENKKDNHKMPQLSFRRSYKEVFEETQASLINYKGFIEPAFKKVEKVLEAYKIEANISDKSILEIVRYKCSGVRSGYIKNRDDVLDISGYVIDKLYNNQMTHGLYSLQVEQLITHINNHIRAYLKKKKINLEDAETLAYNNRLFTSEDDRTVRSLDNVAFGEIADSSGYKALYETNVTLFKDWVNRNFNPEGITKDELKELKRCWRARVERMKSLVLCREMRRRYEDKERNIKLAHELLDFFEARVTAATENTKGYLSNILKEMNITHAYYQKLSSKLRIYYRQFENEVGFLPIARTHGFCMMSKKSPKLT